MARTLAFIGHQPESLSFGENELDARNIQLKAMLLTEIMDRATAGYNTFLCGATGEADIAFGRLVLLVKMTAHPEYQAHLCDPPRERDRRLSARMERQICKNA